MRVFTLAGLVVLFAMACSESAPARVGEACTPEDGCLGTASCVAGTCFHLCEADSDCLNGKCSTFTNEELGEKINACSLTDAGAGASGSVSSSSSGGSAADTCHEIPRACSGHTVEACATPTGASCYYLVDGSRKVPCASSCDCRAAAQAIAACRW